MESIEKLRDSAKIGGRSWLINHADEIEREIAEKYIALPLDADGVPIRVGDVIQFVNEQGGTGAKVEVCAISEHYAYYGEGKHFYKADMCRHVKERTIEDVLADFLADIEDPERDELETWVIEKYADELRGMMGGE